MTLSYIKSQPKKFHFSRYTASGLELIYRNGQLFRVNIWNADKVDWDGLKHDIEFFEENVNDGKFKMVK